ncbi:MAG: ABC transporter substrate-binding protein [Bacteroidota bacterium]
MNSTPQRIVCLTEETTEWLYLLGEQERIVGISAYTERPEVAKQEKPIVSAYIGGHVEKIKALNPDLVIGFSDVQAELARELITANLQVLITNQRSVEDIFSTLSWVSRLIGAEQKATPILDGYRRSIDQMLSTAPLQKLRVYFEEWDEPAISAIQWVSELIEIAGGENIFADRADGKASKERYVEHKEVLTRNPEVMIGCWCGKVFEPQAVKQRKGYHQVSAIQEEQLFEMDPAIILQPGPACLSDGLSELRRLLTLSEAHYASTHG